MCVCEFLPVSLCFSAVSMPLLSFVSLCLPFSLCLFDPRCLSASLWSALVCVCLSSLNKAAHTAASAGPRSFRGPHRTEQGGHWARPTCQINTTVLLKPALWPHEASPWCQGILGIHSRLHGCSPLKQQYHVAHRPWGTQRDDYMLCQQICEAPCLPPKSQRSHLYSLVLPSSRKDL